MLKTVRRAFQIEDIRKRLFYTFAMLIVVRLGSQLPTPGVDPTFIQEFFQQQTGDALNFFDAFTGGSFTNMSVFALSITPYITSSIIMQLLTIAIPKLEEMQKEGEDGRKKIAAITRYVTVALALIQSIAMAVGFGRQGLLEEYNFVNCAVVVCTLTAGSAFLMWIGERITEKGVGNGISIVLLINILSRIPDDFVTLYTMFIQGKKLAGRADVRGLFYHVHQPVLFQPDQNGIHGALHHIGEAHLVQPAGDLIAIGFPAADDLQHTALQNAFQHLGQVLHFVPSAIL